jgi:hypothetical protein
MINALDSCRREKRWDLNELRATKATAKRFRATRTNHRFSETTAAMYHINFGPGQICR